MSFARKYKRFRWWLRFRFWKKSRQRLAEWIYPEIFRSHDQLCRVILNIDDNERQ